MQPIYFNRAGKIMLNKYVNGVPVKSATTSFFRAGVVQSIQPNVTINGTPIEDGNSLWPAATPDTSIEGSIAVQLGFMPPELYAFIMGDTSQELTKVPFPAVDEEYTIPSTADAVTEQYIVKLNHAPLADSHFILVGTDGNAWEEVESEPGQGEYVLVGDELEFAAADAGKPIYVSYEYEADKVTNFGLPKTPVRSNYELVIVGEATGEDDALYDVALTVDRSKVSGQINLPTQGGTPQPITITFSVLKPRGNNKAVDYKATLKTS